jgi:channel protein (hemolysin III family)
VYSAFVAAVAGLALVLVSWIWDSTRAGIATLIYAVTIVGMFAVSGAYHRVHWKTESAHKWMKRLDHSMIFVFIAGSYTPFALLALPERDGWLLFWIVWGGAAAGVVLKMFWPSAPRWVGVPLYLLLGWVAVWFIGRHSLKHLQSCSEMFAGSRFGVPLDFALISLLAILGLLPFALRFDFSRIEDLFAASICLIAGLTLPHMIVSHRMSEIVPPRRNTPA